MQPGGGTPYPPTPYPWAAYVPPWAVAPPPAPRPRGVPTRIPFLVGGVGHFFSAGMAIPFSIIGLGGFFFFGGFGTVLLVIVSAMSAGGLVVHLVGFFGLWRNYGSQLALATFVFGLVAVGYSVATTVMIVTVGPLGLSSFPLTIVFLAGAILIGVMYIVEGSAYIVNRHYLLPGAAIAAGVLFIIAGGFVCSLLLEIVGGILTVPALIIGGILLTKAPIPIMYAVPRMDEPMAGPTQEPPAPP